MIYKVIAPSEEEQEVEKRTEKELQYGTSAGKKQQLNDLTAEQKIKWPQRQARYDKIFQSINYGTVIDVVAVDQVTTHRSG